MPPLTPMQLRILRFLSGRPGLSGRMVMRAGGVGASGYAKAIGRHQKQPATGTLLDRGFVRFERPNPQEEIEYEITEAGRLAVQGIPL
jgi:hypothetical protein